MEPGDSFGWIMEACQVSSSEESRLRRCSYFDQSDSDDFDSNCRNSPDIPVASTGIAMVCHLESPQGKLPNNLPEKQEIFHTPPEYRSSSTSFDDCNDERMIDELDCDGETVSIDTHSADSLRAVDLRKDTDLGFSEMEVDSTQKFESNSNPDGRFQKELEEIKVLKRGFSPNEKLSNESPSKRFKSFDFEFPNVRLGTPKGRNTSLNTVSPSPIANSELEQKTERKRALPSWAYERVEDDERADEELEVNETVLPSWANGRVGMMRELTRNWMLMHGGTHSDSLSESFEENMVLDLLLDLKNVTDSESGERDMDTENKNGEGSSRGTFGLLLDVLVEVEEDSEDRSLECLSLLEVAERIGGTFPRPSDRTDRSQEGSKF